MKNRTGEAVQSADRRVQSVEIQSSVLFVLRELLSQERQRQGQMQRTERQRGREAEAAEARARAGGVREETLYIGQGEGGLFRAATGERRGEGDTQFWDCVRQVHNTVVWLVHSRVLV